MVILENYEASVSWFPIKWNEEKFLNILLSNKNSVSGVEWKNNINSRYNRQIDYILFYGNLNKFNENKWDEFKEILKSKFKLKFKSEDNYIMLYERVN